MQSLWHFGTCSAIALFSCHRDLLCALLLCAERKRRLARASRSGQKRDILGLILGKAVKLGIAEWRLVWPVCFCCGACAGTVCSLGSKLRTSNLSRCLLPCWPSCFIACGERPDATCNTMDPADGLRSGRFVAVMTCRSPVW